MAISLRIIVLVGVLIEVLHIEPMLLGEPDLSSQRIAHLVHSAATYRALCTHVGPPHLGQLILQLEAIAPFIAALAAIGMGLSDAFLDHRIAVVAVIIFVGIVPVAVDGLLRTIGVLPPFAKRDAQVDTFSR